MKLIWATGSGSDGWDEAGGASGDIEWPTVRLAAAVRRSKPGSAVWGSVQLGTRSRSMSAAR